MYKDRVQIYARYSDLKGMLTLVSVPFLIRKVKMDKYITVEKQIRHLIDLGLDVTNMEKLNNILNDSPYQLTINQVKYYYKVKGNYYFGTSDDLINKYYQLKEMDMRLFQKILLIEAKIKNDILIDVSNNELINNNNFVSKMLDMRTWNYIKTDRKVEYLKRDFYKFINHSSSEQLRNNILPLNGIDRWQQAVTDNYNNYYISSENRTKYKRNYMISTVKKQEKTDIESTDKHSIINSVKGLYDFSRIIQTELLFEIAENAINEVYDSELYVIKDTYCNQLFDSKRNLISFRKQNEKLIVKIMDELNGGSNKKYIKKQKWYSEERQKSENYIIQKIYDDYCIALNSNCTKKYLEEIISNKAVKNDFLYQYALITNKYSDHEIEKMYLISELDIIFEFRNKIAHGFSFVQVFKESHDIDKKNEILKQLLSTEDFEKAKLFIGFHLTTKHL